MKNVLLFCFYFIFSLFFLKNFILHPAFNIIDDGWSITVGKSLLSNMSFDNWSHYLYEKDIGRFRPLYYLYFLPLSFFEKTPLIWWIFQAGILGTTFYFIENLLRKLDVNVFLRTFLPLAVVMHPGVTENFFRLGPAEPRQFIFVIIYLIFYQYLLKKNFNVSYKEHIFAQFLLLCSLLSKETSFSLLFSITGVTLLHGLFTKKIANNLTFIFYTFLTSISFFFLIPPAINYTSNYSFSFAILLERILLVRYQQIELFYVFLIYSILFIYNMGSLLFKKREINTHLNSLLLFSTSLFFIFMTLPWLQFSLERYYYAPVILGCLALIIEIDVFFKNIYSSKFKIQAYSLFFVVGLFLLAKKMIFLNISPDISTLLLRRKNISENMFIEYQINQPLISYLEKTNVKNYYLYEEDYERIQEIGLFSSKFNSTETNIFTYNQLVMRDFKNKYENIHFHFIEKNSFLESFRDSKNSLLLYRPGYIEVTFSKTLLDSGLESLSLSNSISKKYENRLWNYIKK